MVKKIVIPLELKYDFALGAYATLLKSFLYAIREKFGAAIALEIYERVQEIDDRIKNFTNTLLNIFKLEGNDAETIGEWFGVWAELTGQEVTILERSKTLTRHKYTKCPFKTEPKDISKWDMFFVNRVSKTINPKATAERLKAMCAGDPYCDFVWKIEEEG